MMKYISLFTGIGGLEDRKQSPIAFCEIDPASYNVLRKAFPESRPWDDIMTFEPESAEVVAGGWPCQDLTVAGAMRGIHASRSALFFRMVDIAVKANAHTLIAENVPNLMRIRKGQDFDLVLKTLSDKGFPYIAWRTLDAREFGLPQKRARVYIVASKHLEIAESLHRSVGEDRSKSPHQQRPRENQSNEISTAHGFYWTGGNRRSLCLYEGYTPALKVGSSTSKGTSPVAVFYDSSVRKLTPYESLKLQGFDRIDFFDELIPGDVFRMAGNAVPRPVGAFVMASADAKGRPAGTRVRFGAVGENGLWEDGIMWVIEHIKGHLAINLADYLDAGCSESLSPQASAGFLTRIIRGERLIPLKMFDILYELSLQRTSLLGTRIDSFEILHREMDALAYRKWIETQECTSACKQRN